MHAFCDRVPGCGTCPDHAVVHYLRVPLVWKMTYVVLRARIGYLSAFCLCTWCEGDRFGARLIAVVNVACFPAQLSPHASPTAFFSFDSDVGCSFSGAVVCCLLLFAPYTWVASSFFVCVVCVHGWDWCLWSAVLAFVCMHVMAM